MKNTDNEKLRTYKQQAIQSEEDMRDKIYTIKTTEKKKKKKYVHYEYQKGLIKEVKSAVCQLIIDKK